MTLADLIREQDELGITVNRYHIGYLDLSYADLRHVDLSYANLSGAIMPYPQGMTSYNGDVYASKQDNKFTYTAGCFSSNATEAIAKVLKERNNNNAKAIIARWMGYPMNEGHPDAQLFLDKLSELSGADAANEDNG